MAHDRLVKGTLPLGRHVIQTADAIAERLTAQAQNVVRVSRTEVLRRACTIGLEVLSKELEKEKT